jgi:hypothetical protein
MVEPPASTRSTAHLSVELDLTEVELRLRDEESAERVMRQQLDDQTENPWVGSPWGDPILDRHCQNVAQDAFSRVATRSNREFPYAYAKFFTVFVVITAATASTIMLEFLLMIRY